MFFSDMSQHVYQPNSLVTFAAASLLKHNARLFDQVPRTLQRCLRWDWFLAGRYVNRIAGQTGWDEVKLEALSDGARVTLKHGPHYYLFEVPYVASTIRSSIVSSLLGVSQRFPVMGQTIVTLGSTKIHLTSSRPGFYVSEICFEAR